MHIAKIRLRKEKNQIFFKSKERPESVFLWPSTYDPNIFVSNTRQKSFSGWAHAQNHFQVAYATKKVDKASITGKQR